MRLWTVHEPGKSASADERADGTLFVKDGFSWWGLFFPLPWLLIQRLWLGTLIYVLLSVAAGAIGMVLPLSDGSGVLLGLIGNLYVAFEGNDMRRRKLARLGYVHVGSVIADSRVEAEIDYFSSLPKDERPRSASVAYAGPTRRPEPNDVLGLFPEPGGGR